MAMKPYVKPLSYLVAALLAVGLISVAIPRGDQGKYKVTAYFEKAIGLFPNSDVSILGVPVGKVKSVEPVGRSVKVEMYISDDYKIPAHAFAQIVPISVISDRYIQLAPVYQEGDDVLEDGAVLDLDKTQIPAELDDVFKQLKKLLDAIEPGQPGEPGALGELIVQLDETLRDKEEDLQGTLVGASKLTQTLARGQDHLSNLLVNLDDLFGKLATRAGSYGRLNQNLALTLTALAESRQDLEDTLANLANLTGEVGGLVQRHKSDLDVDLDIAARIARRILDHRESVEESLSWLPVVGEAASNAYHKPPIDAVDVRDNLTARIECAILDALPDGPAKDLLEELCSDAAPKAPEAPPAPSITDELDRDCVKGVHKVKRQIKKLAKTDIDAGVKDEILDPLKKRLKKLARKCKELGQVLDDPKDLLDEILDDIGTIPGLEKTLQDTFDKVGGLTGSAAGPSGAVPVSDGDSDGPLDRVGGWMGGFFGFVGWSW